MKTLILTALFISKLTSGALYYEVTGKAPSEVRLIISSIDMVNLESIQQKKYRNLLNKYSAFEKLVSYKDFVFFAKTETYKVVLTHYPANHKIYNNPVRSPEEIKNFTYNKKTLTNLSKWILDKVLVDLALLEKTVNFGLYKKGNLSTKELMVFAKKYRILYTWFSFYNEKSPININEYTSQLGFKILSSINTRLWATAHISSFDKVILKENPRLFKLKKISDEAPKEEKDRLNEILAPIISGNGSNDLPTPINDWKPDEKVDYKGPNILLRHDPSLIDRKEELPTPVNDWILEI